TACANAHQIVLGVQGNELVYFELNTTTNQFDEVARKTLDSEACCMDLGEVPEGRLGAAFVAVGCVDKTVSILSVAPGGIKFHAFVVQALADKPRSVCIASHAVLRPPLGGGVDSAPQPPANTYLYIGLENGVLLRTGISEKG